MNVFIRAMVKIFSFGERWNFPFHPAVASWNGKFQSFTSEQIYYSKLIIMVIELSGVQFGLKSNM